MAARFTRPLRCVKATGPSSCTATWTQPYRAHRALHISPAHLAKAKTTPASPRPARRPATAAAAPRKAGAAPSPNNNAEEAQPVDAIFRQRKWAFVGAGLTALAIGFYVSTVVASLLKDAPSPCAACEDGGGARLSAEEFDRGLDVPELLGGVRGLRREVCAWARGRVLEVAVGTGRNLGFFEWAEVVDGVEGVVLPGRDEEKARRERERREEARVRRVQRAAAAAAAAKGKGGAVDAEAARMPGRFDGEVLSYTGVDISADMLGLARTRLREAVPGLKELLRRRRAEPMPESGVVVDVLDGRVRLCIGDAQQALPAPAPKTAAPPGAEAGKYDTIVQSFGLCSVADPVQVVVNMASVLQPDTGRIYLLEHGRGWFGFLNGWLDKTAEGHFKKHGCWWNRDIEGIVREAAEKVPGLEIVHLGRPLLRQLGTTLVIELRVGPGAAAHNSAP